MSTSAQIAANQINAQHSTGPRSEAGKATSARNNLRHGFTGAFVVLGWENAGEYDALLKSLLHDHQPTDTTEYMLVKTMAQSYWLRERATVLQDICMNNEVPMCQPGFERQLALYLRYQNTHDRAYYKALNELQRLREQKRKQEIGFESQQRRQTQEASRKAEQQLAAEHRGTQEKRRQEAADRAKELHEARVWLTQAQARRHETETTIAQALKMPHEHHSKSAKAA